MSGLRRPANRASDWLVWAVLLGRQFYGRWKLVKEQWLHWVLDVTFREDDSRVRDRIAARNLAILRKIAINLMGRNRTTRISMRARCKQAAWNDDYFLGGSRSDPEPSLICPL